MDECNRIMTWMKQNCTNYPYLCSTASCVLATIIGQKAILCEGVNESCPYGLHFWVELDEIVLDPTAEQFTSLGKYIKTEQYPCTFVPERIRDKYDPNIVTFLNNLKAANLHNTLVYWNGTDGNVRHIVMPKLTREK